MSSAVMSRVKFNGTARVSAPSRIDTAHLIRFFAMIIDVLSLELWGVQRENKETI